jgi:hypothetical protein
MIETTQNDLHKNSNALANPIPMMLINTTEPSNYT